MRVCVLLVFVCVASARTLSGSGFFCRDPDSGMLYPINSTWPSQRFCGNYHCKIRRKNLANTQYGPYRSINITNVHLGRKIPYKDQQIQNTLINSDILSTTGVKNTNDRYLTKDEIDSITELLHKVKKSDLDAIVELYNFAKEFYQFDDKIDTVKNKKIDYSIRLKPLNKKSYWYEPINLKILKTVNEFDIQGVDVVTVKVETPKTSTTKPSTVTYFNGALETKDFRQRPYFYPISNFQRLYSYVKQHSNKPSPWPMSTEPSKEKIYQNTVRRAVFLPLPYKQVPHNYSVDQHVYLKQAFENIDKEKQEPIDNAILINPYLENLHDGISLKKSEDRINDEKKKKRDKPSWQTSDITEDVLNEVRARVNENKIILSLPFRKKITLEKVDSVLNYDDIKRRKRDRKMLKRSITDAGINGEAELYEVYVEKITCKPDFSVPGFFRRGNMSLAYPRCCPQRIPK